MANLEANKAWSDRIIYRTDPNFRHRWVAYRELLESMLTPNAVWVDVGCGNNGMVDDIGAMAGIAVGIDPLPLPSSGPGYFAQGDIRALPIASGSVDLVTLRFVVEHLPHIPEDFADIERILKPGGKMVVLTTNALSPLIIVPRLFPYRLKNFLIRMVFNVAEEDIFPTHHAFNTPGVMMRGTKKLKLSSIQFIQDANYTRKWLFLLLYFGHFLTKPRFLQRFRPNILAVYSKTL